MSITRCRAWSPKRKSGITCSAGKQFNVASSSRLVVPGTDVQKSGQRTLLQGAPASAVPPPAPSAPAAALVSGLFVLMGGAALVFNLFNKQRDAEQEKRKQVEAALEEARTSRQQLETLQASVTQMEASARDLQSSQKQMGSVLSEREQELRATVQTAEALGAELAAVSSSMRMREAELQAVQQAAQTQTGTAKIALKESQRKVVLLEAMVMTLRDKLKEEEGRNTALEAAVETGRGELRRVDGLRAELEERVTHLKEELEAAQARLATAEARTLELEGRVSELTKYSAELEVRVAHLGENLESTASAARAAAVQAERTILKIQLRADESRAELERVQSLVLAREGELTSMQWQIVASTDSAQQAGALLLSKKQELMSVKQELQEIRAQADSEARQRCSELADIRQGLEQQLAATRAEAATARAELGQVRLDMEALLQEDLLAAVFDGAAAGATSRSTPGSNGGTRPSSAGGGHGSRSTADALGLQQTMLDLVERESSLERDVRSRQSDLAVLYRTVAGQLEPQLATQARRLESRQAELAQAAARQQQGSATSTSGNGSSSGIIGGSSSGNGVSNGHTIQAVHQELASVSADLSALYRSVLPADLQQRESSLRTELRDKETELRALVAESARIAQQLEQASGPSSSSGSSLEAHGAANVTAAAVRQRLVSLLKEREAELQRQAALREQQLLEKTTRSASDVAAEYKEQLSASQKMLTDQVRALEATWRAQLNSTRDELQATINAKQQLSAEVTLNAIQVKQQLLELHQLREELSAQGSQLALMRQAYDSSRAAAQVQVSTAQLQVAELASEVQTLQRTLEAKEGEMGEMEVAVASAALNAAAAAAAATSAAVVPELEKLHGELEAQTQQMALLQEAYDQSRAASQAQVRTAQDSIAGTSSTEARAVDVNVTTADAGSSTRFWSDSAGGTPAAPAAIDDTPSASEQLAKSLGSSLNNVLYGQPSESPGASGGTPTSSPIALLAPASDSSAANVVIDVAASQPPLTSRLPDSSRDVAANSAAAAAQSSSSSSIDAGASASSRASSLGSSLPASDARSASPALQPVSSSDSASRPTPPPVANTSAGLSGAPPTLSASPSQGALRKSSSTTSGAPASVSTAPASASPSRDVSTNGAGGTSGRGASLEPPSSRTAPSAPPSSPPSFANGVKKEVAGKKGQPTPMSQWGRPKDPPASDVDGAAAGGTTPIAPPTFDSPEDLRLEIFQITQGLVQRSGPTPPPSGQRAPPPVTPSRGNAVQQQPVTKGNSSTGGLPITASPSAASTRGAAGTKSRGAATVVAAPPTALRLVSGAAMIPHVAKMDKGGEDAYFTSSAGYGGVGVVDGVGGWADAGIDPSDYSRGLAACCANALDGTAGVYDVRSLLAHAQQSVALPGSATICVAVLRAGGVLDIGNLGDGGARVIRKGRVAMATEAQEHQFNMPYQMASPDFLPDTDTAANAQVYQVQLQAGDVVVLATDGVYDNLWDADLVSLAGRAMAALEATKASSGAASADPAALAAAAQQLADAIAGAATRNAQDETYRSPWAVESAALDPANWFAKMMRAERGGKMDDVTAVVAIVA